VLAQRARYAEEWVNCMNVPHLESRQAWWAFRGRLISPAVNPELARIDADGARRIALADAVASFMRSTGEDRHHAMEQALRYSGRGGTGSADALGGHVEWPPSLHAARTSYETARDRVRNIDQRLEQLEGQASSLAQAEAWVRDTHALLDRARAAVEP